MTRIEYLTALQTRVTREISEMDPRWMGSLNPSTSVWIGALMTELWELRARIDLLEARAIGDAAPPR